jgi:hypothetical protein
MNIARIFFVTLQLNQWMLRLIHRNNKNEKNMKKYFIALMMLLTIGLSANAASQHHRHHAAPSSVNIHVNKDSANIGITAYSDTTDADSSDVDSAYTNVPVDDADDDDMTSPPESFFKGLAESGMAGGAIAFLICVVVIIALLSPVLLIAVILYFVFRNRNQKYKLAQEAIARGKSVPQELLHESNKTNEFLWVKGIRNCSIGLGLVCLFWILGAESLIGVGLLVFFMGAGQMVIAKTTHKDADGGMDNQGQFDNDSSSAGSNTENSTHTESKTEENITAEQK